MTTDPFTDAARAEAERRYAPEARLPVMKPTDRMDDLPRRCAIDGFTMGAEWARDHLAAQEVTDAEVDAVAVILYRQRALHHTMESWGREPETVKNLYRLDARAALVTARDARAARRDED